MADAKKPSDAQILSRLRRSRGGRTAAQLNTTSSRLDKLEGVVRVGSVPNKKDGKPAAGRPSILFDVEEHAAEVGATEQRGTDPSAASRDGSLSETEPVEA